MSSFKGRFRYTLDSKGRLNIPARLRKELAPEAYDTFVIIRGFDPCLFLFPEDEWKKFEDKLRELPTNKEKNRRFVRMITSYAYKDQCDKQGRIAIPAELLKIAQIDKDVMIVGVMDRIELWNPEIYEKQLQAPGESYEEIAENIIF
jgi:MraZ protein